MERLTRILERGPHASREEVAAFVADGPPALEPLLSIVQNSSDEEELCTAAYILAILGDERAAPALASRLLSLDETLYDEAIDALPEALSCLATGGLNALYDVCTQTVSEDVQIACFDAIAALGRRTPSLADRAADILLSKVRNSTTPPEPCAMAICGLMDLGRSEAVPIMQAAFDRGGVALDWVGPENVEDWLNDGGGLAELPLLSPLEYFVAAHQAAVHEYAEAFSERVMEGVKLYELEQWEEDLGALARPESQSVAVGRNDPCPCGSGRKYKKCCIDSVRPDALRLRLASVEWPPYGYRLLPSQQVELLGRDKVLEHVEILGLSRLELQQRLKNETDDYLLWAGALRYRTLHHRRASQELVTLVAALDQQHPALLYKLIETLAQLDLAGEENTWELLFRGHVRTRGLSAAWNLAERFSHTDPGRALRMYREVQAVDPTLWTAAAAGIALRHVPERVYPMVLEAVLKARTGFSGVHPYLPDRPCPPEVLEAILRDLERGLEKAHRYRKMLHREDRPPLDDDGMRRVRELVRSFNTAQRLYKAGDLDAAALDARVRTLREALTELVQSALSDRRPRLLVQSHGSGRLVWVVGEDDVPQASSLIDDVAQNWPASQVSTAPWGAGVILAVHLSEPDEDLATFAAVALEESDEPRPRPLEVPLELLDVPVPQEARPVEEEVSVDLVSCVQRVLQRLIRMGKIGAAHTRAGYFWRGVPVHLRGGMKSVMEAFIEEGVIRLKPTLKEDHISIEPRAMPSVWRFLESGVAPGERSALALGAAVE